jgi:hypothetical protein
MAAKFAKIFTAKFIRREAIIMRFFKIISIISDFKSIVDIFKDIIQFISNAIKNRKN